MMQQDLRIQKAEGMQLIGVHKFTVAYLETPEQWELHNRIEAKRNAGEDYIDLVRELNSRCRTHIFESKNLIPTVGRTLIADQLVSSTPANEPKVNYSALGTGTNAPANGNTTLQTEFYRRVVASSVKADNIAYITAFYSSTEVTGTFTEHGLFCDATATANSGVLFSRVLLNGGAGFVKSTTSTLTIDYTLTIN